MACRLRAARGARGRGRTRDASRGGQPHPGGVSDRGKGEIGTLPPAERPRVSLRQVLGSCPTHGRAKQLNEAFVAFLKAHDVPERHFRFFCALAGPEGLCIPDPDEARNRHGGRRAIGRMRPNIANRSDAFGKDDWCSDPSVSPSKRALSAASGGPQERLKRAMAPSLWRVSLGAGSWERSGKREGVVRPASRLLPRTRPRVCDEGDQTAGQPAQRAQASSGRSWLGARGAVRMGTYRNADPRAMRMERGQDRG